MQCPTCGNDTPGTLGKCSHCEAPIDVYSVGPIAPLAAPVADTATPGATPAAGPNAAGTADAFGDRTMMVPPPTPSWAANAQQPATPDLQQPATPDFTSPSQTAPEPPAASLHQPAQPPAPPAPAQPPLQLSVEPPDPPAQPPAPPTPRTQPASAAASNYATPTPPATPLPPVDPEDTAAWTFIPDDDDEPAAPSPSGGFGAPPSPMWAAEQPSPPASGPGEAMPTTFGLEPAPEQRQESIVPESWFAQPRKPDALEQPGAGGQQQPTMMDADATQVAPTGFGGDFDRTRMDPGPPMGAPQMGHAPMGQAPMGQGPMGGQMGPGMPMGPMGQGGPGGPGYGYPPGQDGRPGGGTNKALLAVVAALVTVAVGAVVFVIWPSGDDSSASTDPNPSASNQPVSQNDPIPTATKQQAAAVNGILNDSVKTRRVLAGALGRAGKCKTLPQAIQGFQKVAQHRQNQLTRTKNLKVDRLANGERLRGSLAQALTASLQVDQVLLQWAQQNQRGCRGKPRPSAAQVPGRAAGEKRATTAKQQFVVLWNPVAKKTGQPQRSWKRV